MADHPLKRWGTERLPSGLTRFQLWAPSLDTLSVDVAGRIADMQRDPDGWFSADVAASPGDAYMFQAGDLRFPDPASRAQRSGVHGPSLVTDPHSYAWRTEWHGRPWTETVLYELHIGTFSDEGTFAGAIGHLKTLADLGVTAIEIMPVAQFTGTRGWGYDGVLLYAPHDAYGSPDDFKRLIDAAHALGLMVFLDVVYNHFGPDGNYLSASAQAFFTDARPSPWGAGIDFDRPPVRRFVIDNALYWFDEFRIDGLRLDASDHIVDTGSPELLAELAQAVHARDFGRPVHLTTEDNRNITRLHAPENGLYDGEWNDDYHHAIHCLLTGESEGYYRDFSLDPIADLTTALRDGFVEQGQHRPYRKAPRGEPSGHLPPTAFINFLQNHDQTGNRPLGERLNQLADPEAMRIVTALHLLSPFIPLMFMGEEWLEPAPFLFFADYPDDLARLASEGRKREFADFKGFSGADIPEPHAVRTFQDCKLDRDLDERQQAHFALTQKLLALRQRHVFPLIACRATAESRVERLGPRSLAASWRFAAATLDIRVNLGAVADLPAGAGPTPFFTLGSLRDDPWAIAAAVTGHS